jgi:hypothetical protein
MAIVVAVWALLPTEMQTGLARHWREGAAASCALGVIVSAVFFVRGRLLRRGTQQEQWRRIDPRSRCLTVDSALPPPPPDADEFEARSLLQHFYCGLSEFNPRPLWGVDVKMWLYVVGATQLQLNVLSAAVLHAQTHGWSHATLAFTGCMTWFLVEYLAQERIHLTTYDIFRERVGFKLLWGCLCFYPWFYAIPALPLLPPVDGTFHDLSPATTAAVVALFFIGWTFTRGANYQKCVDADADATAVAVVAAAAACSVFVLELVVCPRAFCIAFVYCFLVAAAHRVMRYYCSCGCHCASPGSAPSQVARSVCGAWFPCGSYPAATSDS